MAEQWVISQNIYWPIGANTGILNGVRAAAYTLISINGKAWQKHTENPYKDRMYSKIGKREGEFQLATQQKEEETVSFIL